MTRRERKTIMWGPDPLPELGEKRWPHGSNDPEMYAQVVAIDIEYRTVTLSVPVESEAQILSRSFLGDD